MAFTYDVSSDIGKVRLIIADSRDDGHIFEDDELSAFLAMNGDSIRLASAEALDTMASNESLVQKVITLLDLRTDGPKVAADLRKHAATLRANDAAATASDDPGFDIFEMPGTVYGEREYLWNQFVRESA